MNTTKDNREIWVDAVRACAALLVVLLHTAAPYLYKIKELDIDYWMTGNYVDSFTRVSVPLFFMISGYLFFQDRKPTSKNYMRLLFALTFYSVLALVYLHIYRGLPIYQLTINIIFKPVFYHLWFFYTLIVIYLFANIIQIRTSVNIYIALALFFVFFVLFNPKLISVLKLLDPNYNFKHRMQLDGTIVYYLMYAVFGAILGKCKANFSNFSRYIFLTLFIASSVVVAYGTYIVSIPAGKYIGTFYHYGSVPVAIGAASLFLYIRTIEFSALRIKWAINLVANSSLVMYGTHAIVLDYIRREGYRDYNNPIIDISAVFLVTVFICFIIYTLIQRIDKKRYIS